MIDQVYDGHLLDGLSAMVDARLNQQQEADYLAGNMLRRDPWEILLRAKYRLAELGMGMEEADMQAFRKLDEIQGSLV